MVHLPQLILDLCFILVTAAATTILFRKLNQPMVLGYLIAGFFVGPHFPFVRNVVDVESVRVWAEIGVIFLLFGLGLEFSFKKLAKVGSSATIAATVEMLVVAGIGYLLGGALGWDKADCIFLGAALAISSTTIIARVFEELGLKSRGSTQLVFGILIVQDLAAVLILVLLATVAVPDTVSTGDVLYKTLRLGFFLMLWFVVGIYALPTLFERVKRFLSDETLLIVSIGLCLLMVVVASAAGFSSALGAFIMGSILAETKKGKRIESLIVPVRNLFGAVFFVSVGMMIEPSILAKELGTILLVTGVTIVGKFAASALGALLAGRSLRHSVQAGASLAQIGEFSFIIATLGITLKITRSDLYPILISVAALTTFATPYLIKSSDQIAGWLERKMPAPFHELLTRYQTALHAESSEGVVWLLWQEYGAKLLINSVMVLAIGLGLGELLIPAMIRFLNITGASPPWLTWSACAVALVASGPFLWAIVVAPPALARTYSPEVLKQIGQLQLGVSIVRAGLGFALLAVIVAQFTTIAALSGVMLVITSMLLIFFSRLAGPFYHTIERRFLNNLDEVERKAIARKPEQPALAPWDATLSEFTLSPHSSLVGISLLDSKLKEKTGVIVTMIQRGARRILAPKPTELLLPYDVLYLLGQDEQLTQARSIVEGELYLSDANQTLNFGLDSLLIEESSKFFNKNIRNSGVREDLDGIIVGIERGGRRWLNPDPEEILKSADRIWVVGDLAKIKSMRSI